MAPSNSIFFVQTEINLLLSAMKWSARQSPRSYHDENTDPLHRGLGQLREILNSIVDLDEIEPLTFLSPFLAVIRSEETTGPITGLALTAVDKFLSYGLLDANEDSTAPAIEAIAEAVTHARFVGTDPSSDEVVLMKILCVLRTLLLIPAGRMLSNEAGCEIMQSCFRICFEVRLSELLRRTAEYTLMNMVQLLFTRLPELKEDPLWQGGAMNKKLKMRKGGMEGNKMRRKRGEGGRERRNVYSTSAAIQATSANSAVPENAELAATEAAPLSEDVNQVPPVEESTVPVGNESVSQEYPVSMSQPAPENSSPNAEPPDSLSLPDSVSTTNIYYMGINDAVVSPSCEDSSSLAQDATERDPSATTSPSSYINPQGVLFTTQLADTHDGDQCDSLDMNHSEISQETSLHPSQHNSIPHYTSADEHDNHLHSSMNVDTSAPAVIIPYGLPCVRELLRFLVSLTSSHQQQESNNQVNNMMIHMGLSLLTVALETGADNIPAVPSLLTLIKNELTKNVMALLHSERLSLFAAALRVCFLLFESMRSHLKFQLEIYLQRMMAIITSESERITFEQREVALESIVQLWRIPGFVTELYLNYDCDLFCSNLFEDLTKLLSKNAFPVKGLLSTHTLSLDALLAVIDGIEQHCHSRLQQRHSLSLAGFHSGQRMENISEMTDDRDSTSTNSSVIPTVPPSSGYEAACIQSSSLPFSTDHAKRGAQSGRASAHSQSLNQSNYPRKLSHSNRKKVTIRPNRMPISQNIPSEEELAAIKYKKKLLINGTEKFNVSPKDGIRYLQEHRIFSTPLEPDEIAQFLRENPRLDKKMIGEYLGSRQNSAILKAFVQSFNFEDVRIDEALRQYLETFRIPGEAPVIQHLLEYFAEIWHVANGEPYANADAAFTLSYAILMLNTDQHNATSRKQNIPMTPEGFRKNLKGMNGKGDFEPELLEKIYQAIKEDEIVLPSERAGAVKENYLWKVLLRRGATEKGVFMHAPTGAFDHDLFTLIWGPTVAALSFVFDKTTDESINQKAIAGFRKCAMISAHYGLSDVFDNLVISLCQFTTLLSAVDNPESLPFSFGRNEKARLAAKTVFNLACQHADILRDGWRNLLDCLLQLYKAHLLPEELIVVEDYVKPNKQIRLIEEPQKNNPKQELGMFSTFYLYFTSDSSAHRGPSQEEQEARKRALDCIHECHIEQLLEDSKFLHDTSLTELIKALISVTKGECSHDALSYHYDQDARVFAHELLMRIMLQNRDRMTHLWPLVRNHFYEMAICSMEPSFLLERTVVGLMRLAHRLLRRHEMMEQGFTCLDLVGILKPHLLYRLSRQVTYGLHELLQTHAASLGLRGTAWRQIFTLLEVCGAGIYTPPERRAEMVERLAFLPQEKILLDTDSASHHSHAGAVMQESGNHPHVMSTPDSACVSGSESTYCRERGPSPISHHQHHTETVNSDGETHLQSVGSEEEEALWQRGYISDGGLKSPQEPPTFPVYTHSHNPELKHSRSNTPSGMPPNDWIMVNREAMESGSPVPPHGVTTPPPAHHQSVILYSEAVPVNQYSIVMQEDFRYRNSRAMQKAVETLIFLVRDPAYINVANFKSCVRTLRVFVEASVNGGAHLSITRRHHHHHRDRGAASRRGHSNSGHQYPASGNHGAHYHPAYGQGRLSSPYNDSVMTGSVTGSSHSIHGGSPHEDAMSGHAQSSAGLRRSRGVVSSQNISSGDSFGGSGSVGQLPYGQARVPVTASSVQKGGQTHRRQQKGSSGQSASHFSDVPSLGAGYSASASSSESEDDEEFSTSGPTSPKTSNKGRRQVAGSNKTTSTATKAATAKSSLQQTMSVQQERNQNILLELLDLMYTLHTRAASIFTDTFATNPSIKGDTAGGTATYSLSTTALWNECWCPLLQSIARLCCDSRRVIRTQALTYLQRALLAPDLHRLTASEWEDCFTKVLFPLLSCLLEDINPEDPSGMEETRMRASTLLSKVFLQHLAPMFSLPTFTALWLTILDFMDKYMHVSGSDLLVEAVPESLKNMLLVMDTANVLRRPGSNGSSSKRTSHAAESTEEISSAESDHEAQIWRLTWDRISAFLPNLQAELFPAPQPITTVPPLPPVTQETPSIGTSAPIRTASSSNLTISDKKVSNIENQVVDHQPRSNYNDEILVPRLQSQQSHESDGRLDVTVEQTVSTTASDAEGTPIPYTSYSVVIPIPDTPPCNEQPHPHHWDVNDKETNQRSQTTDPVENLERATVSEPGPVAPVGSSSSLYKPAIHEL